MSGGLKVRQCFPLEMRLPKHGKPKSVGYLRVVTAIALVVRIISLSADLSYGGADYLSSSLPRVSGSHSISPAPANRKSEVTPRALPTPLLSAMAPTSHGALALTDRPML